MKLKSRDEPQGVAKLTMNSHQLISETTFMNGKMIGLSREVSPTDVKLILYGADEKCIGQINWDENFDEIDRQFDGLNELGTPDFAPNAKIRDLQIRKRVDRI